MSDKKQVNVRFEGPVLQQLKDLEKSTGRSISDVLREAVNTSHWLKQQQDDGKKIFLQEEKDGGEKLVQVILR